MKKKGALFYIIDAFIAAGIIAITISVILAILPHKSNTDVVKTELDNYILFFEKTSILAAPGAVADTIIENVSNERLSLFETVSELVSKGQTQQARNLVADVSSQILAPQFGISFNISNTNLYNKSLNRYPTSKIVLTKNIIISALRKAELDFKQVALGVENTGDDACTIEAMDCRFVYASCDGKESFERCESDKATYSINPCFSSPVNEAHCSTFKQANTDQSNTIVVSIWS